MKSMFTVGEIARLHKLQKQTLIFYDKRGLFKPNIVDKTNNYRYYTADQLETLDSILMLRDIGLSIEQIKIFLEKRAPKAAIEALTEQKSAVSKQAKHLTQTAQRLERKIETLKILNKSHGDKIISTTKDEYFAIEKISLPNDLLKTDIATKALLTRAYGMEYPFYYQVGVIVPLKKLYEGKFEAAEYAVLPLTKKQKTNDTLIKPAGLYARGYHCGEYSKIGEGYQRLLKFIDVEGFIPVEHAFEYCVSDSLTAKSPLEYVTEIQIPVKIKQTEACKSK